MLVDSVGGSILPRSGGWDNQYPDFCMCWLIFVHEKKAAEAAIIEGKTGR